MHPYFSHRMADQYREELTRHADNWRSAHTLEARPSRSQLFWTLLRRRGQKVRLVRPLEVPLQSRLFGSPTGPRRTGLGVPTSKIPCAINKSWAPSDLWR